MGAALTLASPSSAGIRHDAGAAAAVAELPSGESRAVPKDFKQVMGYEPALATLSDGSRRVVNPTGSCSVPGEGRPFDFAIPCMAHDFGYDLLRYAERKHAPLASDARDTIDALLTHDLYVQCNVDDSPSTCSATVVFFAAGVGFNSWRQVSGPPVDESGLTRTAGLVLLAGLGVGGLPLSVRWRRRSRVVRPAVPAC